MKKLILVALAIVAASGIALADIVNGTTGTPASHPVTLTVIVPPRVGINIATHDYTMDAGLDPGFPPSADSAFTVATGHAILIISTGNYDYGYSASMTTAGDGSVALGDYEYQGNGWAPGGAGWHTFAASETWSSGAARTAGWVNRDMDYRVHLDGTETADTYVLTVTYTVTAN